MLIFEIVECDTETKSGSLLSLLKLPPVMMICAMMIVISMTWGFLDPTLEPHLRKVFIQFHINIHNGFI